MKKLITVVAFFVTCTAIGMTAGAALERGATVYDKVLLVAMSVVIILGVHLILAFSRRPAAWLVWFGCLLCAIYGHLTFLTYASLRAGEVRAQTAALTVGTERQISADKAALAEIQARPVAIVAAQLAQEHSYRVRSALRVELAEGKRAEALRDDLARLEAVSTSAQVTGTTDPVIARISAVTGVTESTVTVTVGMTIALLLELVGSLLWFEAMNSGTAKVTTVTPVTRPGVMLNTDVTQSVNQRVSASVTEDVTHTVTGSTDTSNGVTQPVTQPVTAPITPVTPDVEPEVVAVIEAVKSGECKCTVAGIRQFLACSQARAVELRKMLDEVNVVPA